MRHSCCTVLLLLVLGCALAGCSPGTVLIDVPGVATKVRMRFDPPPRVIFGPEDAERWIAETRTRICPDASDCFADEAYIRGNAGLPYESESYWRPTRAQIHRFERELARGLQQARDEWQIPHPPPGRLWQYSVQYIGYVHGGQRLIYANGLCGYESEVRQRWFRVSDGGACVFGATFNPETGAFEGVGFNGYG